jgi:creatinine amidohydrolase
MGASGPTSEPSEWRYLTAAEVSARLGAGAVALWPVGATEQHGPHLVTGFDHLAAEAVVMRAAERLGPVGVVLPTLAFGASHHWLALGGTLSWSADTLRMCITDVAESVAAAGGRHLIIVNGHAGNVGAGIMAAAGFYASGPVVEFVSYWDLIAPGNIDHLRRSDDGIGHAGELETAIGLYSESLVRPELIPETGTPLDPVGPGGRAARIHRAPRVSQETGRDGILGDPSVATGELGAAAIDSAVQALVDHCLAVIAAPDRP